MVGNYNKIWTLCKQNAIGHELSTPKTPQHSGIEEERIRLSKKWLE